MLNVMGVGGMVASLLAAASGLAPAADPEATVPETFAAQVVAVNGSGCPAASGTATASADRTSITVTSPAYFAWAGGQAAPTDLRKNCQVNLRVDRPQGWTYAVVRIDSSGFAYLAAGARGVSRVNLYFQGMSQTSTATRIFDGRLADTWQTADAFSPVFAPCGAERNLNINTELRVSIGTSNPAVSSFMVREAKTTYQLAWQRCLPA